MFGHRVTGYTRQDGVETGVCQTHWRSCGLNIGPLGIGGLQIKSAKVEKVTNFPTESLHKMPQKRICKCCSRVGNWFDRRSFAHDAEEMSTLLGHSVYFNTAVTKQDILKILRVSSQKRLKTISYYHGNMK